MSVRPPGREIDLAGFWRAKPKAQTELGPRNKDLPVIGAHQRSNPLGAISKLK